MDAAFHGPLMRRSAERGDLTSPEREARAWHELLGELGRREK